MYEGSTLLCSFICRIAFSNEHASFRREHTIYSLYKIVKKERMVFSSARRNYEMTKRINTFERGSARGSCSAKGKRGNRPAGPPHPALEKAPGLPTVETQRQTVYLVRQDFEAALAGCHQTLESSLQLSGFGLRNWLTWLWRLRCPRTGR